MIKMYKVKMDLRTPLAGMVQKVNRSLY